MCADLLGWALLSWYSLSIWPMCPIQLLLHVVHKKKQSNKQYSISSQPKIKVESCTLPKIFPSIFMLTRTLLGCGLLKTKMTISLHEVDWKYVNQLKFKIIKWNFSQCLQIRIQCFINCSERSTSIYSFIQRYKQRNRFAFRWNILHQ